MVGEAGRPGEYRKRCLTRMPRLNRTCVAHDARRCKENSPEPYDLSVLGMAVRPIGSLTGSKTDVVPRTKMGIARICSLYRSFSVFPSGSAISSTRPCKFVRTSRTLRINNQTHSQTSSQKCEVSRTRAFHISSSSSTPTRHNHSVQHLERIHVDCALICLNSTVHPRLYSSRLYYSVTYSTMCRISASRGPVCGCGC